ncbi:MAG: hypothetical protein ACI97A_003941 [Planctomycetota bacterium]|jgi:hypothetical protein
MTENVVIARLFTSEEALKICNELDSAGVEVIYEPPFLAGNYLVDWNLGTPEFVISVPEAQEEQALGILQELDDQFEADALTEGDSHIDSEPSLAAEPEGDEVEIADDNPQIKRALNVTIMSWLTCIVMPYAWWLIFKCSQIPKKTAVDERRLTIASAVAIFQIGFLLLAYMALSKIYLPGSY